MRDFGGLIWFLIIAIGVITSVVKSARNAQRTRQAQTPQPAAPAQPRQQPPAFGVPRRVEPSAPMYRSVAEVLAPPPPPPPPPAAAPPRPVVIERKRAPHPRPEAPPLLHEHDLHRPLKATRLFGDRRALVRAVIAAEVLGKPLALRDE